MIDDTQQRVLRETLDLIRPLKHRAGIMFYECLFEQTPEIAPMFRNTAMAEQGGKLVQVLEYVVDRLDEWDSITAQIEELGARHAPFGVQSDHFAAVGTALITTLGVLLGEQFSEEAEQAWEELYTELSLVMERGARRAADEGRRGYSRV